MLGLDFTVPLRARFRVRFRVRRYEYGQGRV